MLHHRAHIGRLVEPGAGGAVRVPVNQSHPQSKGAAQVSHQIGGQGALANATLLTGDQNFESHFLLLEMQRCRVPRLLANPETNRRKFRKGGWILAFLPFLSNLTEMHMLFYGDLKLRGFDPTRHLHT
jgi:hypothetical protein